MVSIIKNQLLKHLSRFTKNLSADKINLSTFKGEGELKNLELNEEVLTDLLELPSWLKITKAWSNKVTFKIQWTKLKSVPIVLSLDEINITVETCEELRPMTPQSRLPSYAVVPGKYSFIHKVIDGITVTVNTVNIVFNSPAFTTNVQISRICVESRDPYWRRCDLRMSRLKELEKGQILIFKELTWQTVRIEAMSTKDKNLTPIRLLTNQAWCRITIKKRLSDCFIIGSRLIIILDDLLWVLTDSQLKAALHFVDSLAGLVQKSTLLTRRTKAARKLEELPEYQAQVAQQTKINAGHSHSSKIFAKFDVVETSYHFCTQHIVLHFCDDVGDGRSCHPHFKDGGALQISVTKFKVDYYPYHLAKSNRKHWPGYRDTATPHVYWFDEAFSNFRGKLLDLVHKNKSVHTPLSRSSKMNEPGFEMLTESIEVKNDQLKEYLLYELGKLMTSCLILRIDDFTLYKVTTPSKKQELKVFISAQYKRKEKCTGDKERFSLPDSSNIIHTEFIYFYYPSDTPFPLPPPKLYVHFNPIQIYFDIDTCLWLNSFALTLHKSLNSSKQQVSKSDITYIDIKIEAIMPKIIFESAKDYPNQRDRPKSLHFNVTRATITNVRSLQHSSRADLAKCVEAFNISSLFFGTDFPSKPGDFYLVTEKFLDHITTNDDVRTVPNKIEFSSKSALLDHLSRELFWNDAKDVWNVHLEPVWADFLGAKAVGNKTVAFLDAIPIFIWFHAVMDPNSTLKNEELNGSKHADIHALINTSSLVSVQINHYQYLFLLRLIEDVAELTTFLSLDSNRILKTDTMGSLVVGAVIPQVEMTFVMPSQCPGKESSGDDVESFVPDSSSFQEDATFQAGSSATIYQFNDTEAKFDKDSNSVKTRSIGKWSHNNNFRKINTVLNSNEQVPTLMSPESLRIEQIKPSKLFKQMYPLSLNIETTRNLDSSSANNFQFKESELKLDKIPNGVGNAESVKKMFRPELLEKIHPQGNEVIGNFNAGFSSMKKSLKNMIDSTIRPSVDDMSETLSVKSDISSDSETLEIISETAKDLDPVDLMFVVKNFDDNKTIEVASEVEEDSVTTISEQSFTSSCKRRDLISVATFKLNKVEFIQQSCGFFSSIKVQVSNIFSDECSSIPWDEFQTKFNSRTKAWSETNSCLSNTPKVKLRLDHFLKIDPDPIKMAKLDFSDKDIQRKLFEDFVDVQVNDLNLNLCMSVVTGLVDFIEDEIIPVPLPMMINLRNIELHLNEDRPPTNITSPGPNPIDLNISQMLITRKEDGVFRIEPLNVVKELEESTENIHDEICYLKETIKDLESENKNLKRRLKTLEQISRENLDLRRYKEEYDNMRIALASTEEEVSRLNEENKKLLDVIKIPNNSEWMEKR